MTGDPNPTTRPSTKQTANLAHLLAIPTAFSSTESRYSANGLPLFRPTPPLTPPLDDVCGDVMRSLHVSEFRFNIGESLIPFCLTGCRSLVLQIQSNILVGNSEATRRLYLAPHGSREGWTRPATVHPQVYDGTCSN